MTHGFVPHSVCEEIVRGVDPTNAREATVAHSADPTAPLTVDKTVRNVLVHDAISVRLQVNSELQRIVDELVEPFYGVEIDYWESPDVLIYPPGGFYVPHNDAESVVHDEERFVWEWRRTFDRDISVVWYLNDNFDGGELVFTLFPFTVQPATGMVVTFPSSHEYAHTTKPVISGMRYAVVTWMTTVGSPRVQATPPERVQNRRWQH
ncbi:MAG TPA: 2OG-Fe(II) oxygenase [Terriglobales bacterium]|nr:2OG-Fe(II) oxygenase [Terriglobales bacterium]